MDGIAPKQTFVCLNLMENRGSTRRVTRWDGQVGFAVLGQDSGDVAYPDPNVSKPAPACGSHGDLAPFTTRVTARAIAAAGQLRRALRQVAAPDQSDSRPGLP